MLYPCAVKFDQKLVVHLHETNSYELDPRNVLKIVFGPKKLFFVGLILAIICEIHGNWLTSARDSSEKIC
jgi:hypothetical protein